NGHASLRQGAKYAQYRSNKSPGSRICEKILNLVRFTSVRLRPKGWHGASRNGIMPPINLFRKRTASVDDAIPLLVCDDSSMARKQLIRSLPASWPLRISQAEDGRRGLELIRQGQGRIVLLDLTMPEMNGFDVLAQIRDEG